MTTSAPARKNNPARPFRAVAEAIARELFTDYKGKRAARLAMKYTIDGGEYEGAGWCEKAAADHIEDCLTRHDSP